MNNILIFDLQWCRNYFFLVKSILILFNSYNSWDFFLAISECTINLIVFIIYLFIYLYCAINLVNNLYFFKALKNYSYYHDSVYKISAHKYVNIHFKRCAACKYFHIRHNANTYVVYANLRIFHRVFAFWNMDKSILGMSTISSIVVANSSCLVDIHLRLNFVSLFSWHYG